MANLLFSLDAEKCALVLNAMGERLPKLIANDGDLTYCAINCLDKNIRSLFRDAMKNIPKHISNFWQLSIVLDSLDTLQRQSIFDKIREGLSDVCTKELKEVQPLNEALNQIINKTAELFNSSPDKAEAAFTLYKTITDALACYQQSDKTKNDYTQFKDRCYRAIEVAQNSELKDHRGWKNILVNLFIGIASLGTAFILNYGYTRGEHVFFRTNTNSLNKVDKMQNALALINDNNNPADSNDEQVPLLVTLPTAPSS